MAIWMKMIVADALFCLKLIFKAQYNEDSIFILNSRLSNKEQHYLLKSEILS